MGGYQAAAAFRLLELGGAGIWGWFSYGGRHLAERGLWKTCWGMWKMRVGRTFLRKAAAGNGLPAGEVARSARGGPSFVFAACGRPAGSPLSFFLLEFSGIPAGWLPPGEGFPLLGFSGIPPEGLSGPAPTGGLLSCTNKKVTKEVAGGLCRPPGPQALSFQTCGRSWPSG